MKLPSTLRKPTYPTVKKEISTEMSITQTSYAKGKHVCKIIVRFFLQLPKVSKMVKVTGGQTMWQSLLAVCVSHIICTNTTQR